MAKPTFTYALLGQYVEKCEVLTAQLVQERAEKQALAAELAEYKRQEVEAEAAD